jgi:tRNA(adenine34) deaminase
MLSTLTIADTDRFIEMMKITLKEAQKAEQKGEVPIGAVLTDENHRILSKAYNQTITLSDPTAHAEILVLREGARKISNYRLLNTSLYVTVEPCVMCMGAIVHARVGRVVFGAFDPKWGAGGSLYDLSTDLRLNHHPIVVSGILESECRELMQNFFRSRR